MKCLTQHFFQLLKKEEEESEKKENISDYVFFNLQIIYQNNAMNIINLKQIK